MMTLAEENIIGEIVSTMESGSILSIFYDTYSMGWTFGFKIFYYLINHYNSLGVIHNYSLPVPRLISRAIFASKPDLIETLKRRKLLIVDIFGSKYNIHPNEDYVIPITNPTEETLVPKIEKINKERIHPLAKTGNIVRLIYTVDGSVALFGEVPTLKT
ncbi:hypothetical protein [Thermococcus peptonophilus]|uniref:Uncharacterized protein n=1 Tax=Thermococcus peptonophilus TaxID=53952 RepID=A0A142CW45_9EURY|nr:hypothetical protein [Thermococcus peptonophilus]AMQ18997.1 hypothetical protein A0127_07350 [Thermococcus peptonophilus]